MANVTDPLISAVSGSDPQNLLEYITRQRIYDSRYWKEECFGLSVEDVLEKAADLECIGGLPTHFLCLALKMLQLHPETDMVVEAFIEQEDFKYVRALGCLYVRWTGRPAEIYEALEPCYADRRKLRVYIAPEWSLRYMDEFIHELLHQPTVLGLALPRLPNRRTMQESGYLPEGPRPTALRELLEQHGGPLEYFRYKAKVEKSAPAVEAWAKRNERLGIVEAEPKETEKSKEKKEKRPKKKQRNYENLFKSKSGGGNSSSTAKATTSASGVVEGSDEYWNEERAKLGLKPLQK